MIVTLTSFSLGASEDCADLKNGEILRLDEKGKSLENFKVQDQDGVGTCYANTTSLILESLLENHPQVSYLQVAAISKTSTLEQLRSDAKAENFDIYAKQENDRRKNWRLAIEGGTVCKVISELQKEQAKQNRALLCPRKNISLEREAIDGDSEHNQYRNLVESARYLNKFQGTFKDVDEEEGFFNKSRVRASKKRYEEFKKAFTENLTGQKKEELKIKCQKLSADDLDNVLADVIHEAEIYSFCFEEKKSAEYKSTCDVIKALIQKPEDDGSYSIKSKGLTAEFGASFKAKLSLPHKKKYSNESLKLDLVNSLMDNVKPNWFQKKYYEKTANQLFAKLDNAKLSALVAEYNEVLENGFSKKCADRMMESYLTSKSFERDWEKNEILCQNRELMEQAGRVLVDYRRSGLNDIDRALDFILDKARSDYDDAFLALYGKDCKEEDKILLPKNISCEDTSVNLKNKKEIDREVVSAIKENRPLGVFLCAEIIKKPKSEFYANECGHHAVSLIGVSCRDGKYQYLIQNSWGKDSKAKNPAITTEDGKGSYWFDEQSFYDSAYNMVKVKKD